jgi:two-component system, sensor histidine kinase and response regulator
MPIDTATVMVFMLIIGGIVASFASMIVFQLFKKHQRKELEDRENSYRLVIETLSTPIVIKGNIGNFIWANRAFKQLYTNDVEQHHHLGNMPVSSGKQVISREVTETVHGTQQRCLVKKTIFELADHRSLTCEVVSVGDGVLALQNLPGLVAFIEDLVATSNHAVVVTDFNDKSIISINPEACQLFNVKRADIIGVNEECLCLQSMFTDLRMHDNYATSRPGALYECEESTTHPERGKRFYKVTRRLLSDSYGNPLFLVRIWEDQTPVIRREESLQAIKIGKASLNELTTSSSGILNDIAALMANSKNFGLIVTNREGEVVWTNQWFLHKTEYTLPEILGKKPGTLVQGPETDPFVVSSISRAIRNREPFSTTILNYSKSGKKYWINLDVTPYFDEHGELDHFFAVQTDVTEQVDLQNSIRALNRFVQSIVDDLPTPLCVTDSLTHTIKLCNKAYEQFAKLPQQELIGTTGANAYIVGELRQLWDYDRRVVSTRGVVCMEDSITIPQTGRRILRTTKFPLFDELGAVAHIATLIEDITEAREKEISLEVARFVAEEANAAKGEFLAVMSHEIRTPLSGVITMLDLISRTHLTDDQKKFVSIGQSSATSLLSIISDVLDLSKIEANRMDLSVAPFSLRDLLSEVTNMLSIQATNKGITLLHECADSLPLEVIGDADRIRQVCVNLIGNAIKFTDVGFVRVLASGKEIDTDTYEIVFQFEDTGIGIPEDKLKKLFKPFSQVDSSTTRGKSGTGLGLVISQRLAHLMDGDLLVDTSPGKGSCFTFHFKVKKACSLIEPSSENSVHHYLVSNYGGEFGSTLKVLPHTNPFEVFPSLEHLERYLADEAVSPGRFWLVVALVDIEHHIPVIPRIISQLVERDLYGKFHIIKDIPVGSETKTRLGGEKGIEIIELSPEAFTSLLKKDNSEATTSLTVLNKDLRILVVEDNMVNQIALSEYLRMLDIAHDVVNNGQEAIDIITTKNYSLILMDCQMPVMDGYTATQLIRQLHPPISHLPIIALTANALTGDREKCLSAGMSDYLTKPIDLERLKSALGRHAGVKADGITSSASVSKEVIDVNHQLPLFNKEEVLRRFGGNTEIAHKVMIAFVDQVSQDLTRIASAQKALDVDALFAVAHGLKGACQLSGAFHAERIATTVTELARARKTHEAIDKIPNLLDSLQRTRDVIHHEVQQSEATVLVNSEVM